LPSLLALDVDGTLLTSAGELSVRTRHALLDADRAGWQVTLITGRPLPYVLPVARELGVGHYVVAANGGTIAEIDSGALLYQSSVSGELVRTALSTVRAVLPDVRAAVTTTGAFQTERGFDLLAPLSKAGAIVVDDATPLPEDVVHSVVLFALGADTSALRAQIAALVPAGIDVSSSGLPGSVELTAPGVHKGSGLVHLCELLRIERHQVVAFGDGLNDHEMLMWAGHGVAMGNAADETKAVADEVTASNDRDGIAIVVERLLDGMCVHDTRC
jgi:Cof subfamily protein (haloacid dehalogenase superfamily)